LRSSVVAASTAPALPLRRFQLTEAVHAEVLKQLGRRIGPERFE